MPGSIREFDTDGTRPVVLGDRARAARITEMLAEGGAVRGRSLLHDAIVRFGRNRAAAGALIVLLAVVAFGFAGPALSIWSNEEIDWSVMADIAGMGHPSLATGHFFGVDDLGRDLYARTVQATRTSLFVGLVGALVAVFIGTLYGAVAGFAGGAVDNLMMRMVDILVAVPYMFVIILLMVMFERSFFMLFLGIGIISWLDMSRVVRGQTLSLKNREFVEAARAAGVGWFMIILRHIMPNLIGIVAVHATLLVPQMILVESFISYLGLGVQEPNTSLGALISEGAGAITYGTPWRLTAPLILFLLTILSLFFIGDGLRDALDPKES